MNAWIIVDAAATDRCIFPALTHPDWQLWIKCGTELPEIAQMAIAKRIRDRGGADKGDTFTCYIHAEHKHGLHPDGSVAQVFVAQYRVNEAIDLKHLLTA